MKDCRFVFVMPAYNAQETIQQSLLSVVSQTYKNWKVIVRDDMSSDNTVQLARQFQEGLGLQGKIDIQVNTEKKWEVRNVLEMIAQCEDDDVICRLDADDWLTDLDILAILNYRYAHDGVDVAWTAHRWGFSYDNISKALALETNVYKHPWVSSHFKTFRKKLINDVSDHNFRDRNGEYFKRIGDQAIYLPVLNRARKRYFEPLVAYHYTINRSPETFQTDDAKYQKQEADFLRQRQIVFDTPYGRLQNGEFSKCENYMAYITTVKKKFSFIFHRCSQPSRGAVHMRAIVPAYHITNNSGIRTFCEQSPNEKLVKGDVAIFVKHVNEEELERAIEKKCITVFDPVDNFFSLDEKRFDAVIACNKIHAEWLQVQFPQSKIIIIDHLHTNVERKRLREKVLWWQENRPCHVKYVGGIDAFSTRAMQTLQSTRGNTDDRKNFTFGWTSPQEMVSLKPENLHTLYEDADVGVIFADETCDLPSLLNLTGDDLRKFFKPSNKLTSFMSYGIPTVFNFHESYRATLEKYPRMLELCVNTPEEMLQKIRRLATDAQFYQEMSNIFYQAADEHHMDKAYDLYVEQILKLSIEK